MKEPLINGAFLERYPEYRTTRIIDELRATDYKRLDSENHVYLDYTGGAIYSDSQVRLHTELLTRRIFGNPHSASPASMAMTALVEQTRRAILKWFNATDDYTAVFTLNATGALKQIGESYPFSSVGCYLLSSDNHNSVNGIREFALSRNASVRYAPLTMPDLRIDREMLSRMLAEENIPGHKLFAFPAQSNFSGVRHPLDLIEEAHSHGWDVLLDAAAYVPTRRLDLGALRPEFAVVSFYKMFGYPTGVGCLMVRNTALSKLRRPWFAGGTVNFATVRGRRHILSPGEAGFEDGTLNYLAIPAVGLGLQHLESIGMETIGTRVHCLTGWLLQNLLDLKHDNGRHMVRVYGPADTEARGGTVTLNFYDPSGRLLDYRRVEELAAIEKISLRTGCFCNPGAGETAEGLTEEDMIAAASEGNSMTLPRFLQFITHRGGKSAGAIRISLGLASNFEDVTKFLQFSERLRNQTQLTIGEATFDIESCRVIRDGS